MCTHPDWEWPTHLSTCVPVQTSRLRVAYRFIYLCAYTNIQNECGLPIYLHVCLYKNSDRVNYPSIYLCACTQHPEWEWTTHLSTYVSVHNIQTKSGLPIYLPASLCRSCCLLDVFWSTARTAPPPHHQSCWSRSARSKTCEYNATFSSSVKKHT